MMKCSSWWRLSMHLLNLFYPDTKWYGHYISLGYNCETAYQFLKRYHFVEAGLFAWTNTLDIQHLIAALNNLDRIGAGEFTRAGAMWKCENSGIHFHGKALISEAVPQAEKEKILKADKAELISRTAHLKEKFRLTGCDGKKNLYLFKYKPTTEENAQTAVDNINALYQALKKIIRNDFHLLIIFEKNTFPELTGSDNPCIFIRRVTFFTPEENVTGKDADFKGWQRIFKEFRPDFKLKQNKKFKFEEI